MRKYPVDLNQSDRRNRSSQQRQQAHGLPMRLTPVRIIVGVLALTLLVISAASAFIIVTRSYAATSLALNTCTTTSTPKAGSTQTSGTTPTATPRHHKTPVATPTDTPTSVPPTDTPTSVPPTNTPTSVPPTNTPTSVPPTTPPTQSSSSVTPSSTNSVVLLSMNIHLLAATSFDAGAQCASTTTPAGTTQTPAPRSTTVTGSTPGTTPVATTGSASGITSTPGTTSVTTTTSGNQSANGTKKGGSPVALIVSGACLVLLAGLGAGWFFFRRTLMPANAPNTHLPPSGARPWSRTRVPNPDSVNGMLNHQSDLNGGPGSNMSPGPLMNNSYNGPDAGFAGPPGMNGAGFGGYSDGFIPPSPQIFAQNENSMIPPGSGAFPLIGNANGFAPASSGFNAMYGLPDDPFASSQGGAADWMANLESGNGFKSPPTTPNGANLAPDQVDLNDPYLAEVIRQYSQKSQTVQQPMPPNGPIQQMSPNGPLQQMSPNLPASPLPQREPGTNMQEPNWLQ